MPKIAAVSRDQHIRIELARAFDSAPASWSVSLNESAPGDSDVIVCGADVELEGAVSFDIDRPEQVIEDIRDRLGRNEPKVVSVIGAVGGSGATSIALHLAATASSCAMEIGHEAFLRRLAIRSNKSWTTGLRSGELELSALPVAPGFRVVASSRDEAPDRAPDAIVPLASSFGPLFVDVHRRALEAVLALSTQVLLVVPPTRPAAEAALEIVSEHEGRAWGIVVNRCGPGGELRRSDLEAILSRRIAIELPCCPALRDAEDGGRVLDTPLSPWTRRIRRLWRTIEAL